MFEWSDTDLMVRDTVRQFVDKEVRPHLDELESGELSPYPIARKLFSQFGLDVLAAESVKSMLDRERAKQDGTVAEAEVSEHRSDEEAIRSRPSDAGDEQDEKQSSPDGFGGIGVPASMVAVLVSELAGVSIGLLSTATVSLGLGAASHSRRRSSCRRAAFVFFTAWSSMSRIRAYRALMYSSSISEFFTPSLFASRRNLWSSQMLIAGNVESLVGISK